VALACALLAGLYAAVSIQQYNRMEAYVYDLGFFEAIIHDYAQGRLPKLSWAGDAMAPLHFSPALALFAPLVIVWPSPIALLIAQAVLVAVGLAPLMRATSGWTAWVVALTYGLAPAFGALVGFDFHEVALAVPLLAFSMAAMLRGDHRAAVLWAMPLVLVKEDLGLTVAALGAVVFLRGSRRWGTIAMLFGAVTFLVLLVWVLPVIQADASFVDRYAPTGPGEALQTLSTSMDQKARTVLFLLLPTGLLALRSPLLLVVLPTYGWRFVTDRATYWYPWYQYDAVLVPIAVAAMIEGAALLGGRLRQIGLALAVVATLYLLPQQAFSQAWDPDFWDTPSRTAAVDRVLDRIPDGSVVAASDTLGARIALRTELNTVGDTVGLDGPPLPAAAFADVEWIAFDSSVAPAPVPAWRGFARLIDSGEFAVVAESDGVFVARRVHPATGE
jgi:uncharacterized membrane protein